MDVFDVVNEDYFFVFCCFEVFVNDFCDFREVCGRYSMFVFYLVYGVNSLFFVGIF